MKTMITQPPQPPIPSRSREPIGSRPLPKGIVGIAQPAALPVSAALESAPEGTLIVGRDIHVKGQIDDCRALVVEGRVEATLKAARLEVRKGGTFVGSAEVDQAVVAGTFEGNLKVSGQMAVTATGLVRGDSRYAQITIEAGGAIVGTVDRAGQAEEDRNQRPSLAGAGT